MIQHDLHASLERIANLMRGERRRIGVGHGLQPVQLEALHYLALCNRYSDTPQGVADYLGLTKGTVSQSLKVLDARGMIRRRADEDDKRVVHLALTSKGRRVVADAVPGALFGQATMRLDKGTRKRLAAGLAHLLGELQSANGSKTFGVCASCRYHRPVGRGAWRCELLDVALRADDVGKICREHTPPERDAA